MGCGDIHDVTGPTNYDAGSAGSAGDAAGAAYAKAAAAGDAAGDSSGATRTMTQGADTGGTPQGVRKRPSSKDEETPRGHGLSTLVAMVMMAMMRLLLQASSACPVSKPAAKSAPCPQGSPKNLAV